MTKNVPSLIVIAICIFQSSAIADSVNENAEASRKAQIAEHLVKLPDPRLEVLLTNSGRPVSEGLMNCLCGRAGGCGVGGGAYYVAGKGCECVGVLGGHFKPNKPRDPEVVSKSCKDSDGRTVVDAIESDLGKLASIPSGRETHTSSMNLPTKEECKERVSHAKKLKKATTKLEAAEWFHSQGKSVLPPPIELAEFRELQQSSREQLLTKIQRAKKLCKRDAKLPSMTAIKDNKKAFDVSIKAVGDILKARVAVLKVEEAGLVEDHKKAWKDYKLYRTETAKKQWKSALSSLNNKGREHRAAIAQGTKDAASIELLGKSFGHAKSAVDAYIVYEKMRKGEPIEGMLGAAEIYQKYLARYSEKMAAAEVENNIAAGQIAQISSGLGHTVKIANKARKAYGIYRKFEAIQRESNRLYETGKFSESSLKMYKALEIVGQGTKIAAEYMPHGVKEAAQYYAEMVLLPAKLDEQLKRHLDRMDYGADIYGSMAQTPAMKEYEGTPLIRDDYLYRGGGLGVYNTDTGKYFAVTSPDQKKATELSKNQYEDLKRLAYYYSVAEGKKLTNPQLQGILTGDLEMAEGISFASIARLRKKAKAATEEAAVLNALRKRLGRNDITAPEIKRWKTWQSLLRNTTGDCPLTAERESRLHSSYMRNSDKVRSMLYRRKAEIRERNY